MIDLLVILIFLLLILSLIGMSWFAGSDAPYIPTSISKIRPILKLAGLKKDKIFYELGSGDGRVVIEAAKLGAEAYGIEQSWLRVWYSRFKAFRQHLKKIQFYHGNIFDRQYFPADVVYIYLLPQGTQKLEKKLQQELKKDALIITQKYHFKKWKAFRKLGDFRFYRLV
ncbi:hypothetical protein HYS93_05000 [Candidatus Daviesbacteria bacterium]|nr:hypothetical protein [Candidatus Daviesbacteria bacterium]